MYEKDVLKEMLYEAMIIGDDIAYIDMYNKYKVKYDFIKNYSLLIGTNELQHSNFYKSIIGQIHTKKYFDSFTKDGKKIYLVNPLSDYKNLLYISEDFKKEPYVDHTIFLDNQAVNMFVRFFDKKIQNDFVDTQIKYENIRLNNLQERYPEFNIFDAYAYALVIEKFKIKEDDLIEFENIVALLKSPNE